MRRIGLIVFITILFSFTHFSFAVPPSYPIIVENGTSEIFNSIKAKAQADNIESMAIGDIVLWAGLQLINSPYKSSLLDKKNPEYLYISLSNTDCMLFVEEVTVLSRLIKHKQLTFENYINGIKQIRYHGSVSYCNRNHYFKDWVFMNQQYGTVEDIAIKLTNQKLPYKANILSTIIGKNINNIHHQSVLCILEREKIVDSEVLGYIPIKDIGKYQKYIKNGDIIGVVTNNLTKADSIRHLGIAYIKNHQLGYLNASSRQENMKVVVYDNLIDYLVKNNDVGIVVIRVL